MPKREFTARPSPFVVVLTGGIASGKSTVSERFQRLGVPIIDTDVIAKNLVEPGKPALNAIIAQFGEEYLHLDGRLNRSRLRTLVFSKPEARQKLELILHPAIRKIAKRQVSTTKFPYCILVIPLFVESSRYDWVDRVLVVDVPEDIQLKRVMARDNLDRQQAKAILATQASRNDRLALADDVIENMGKIEDLEAEVARLHEEYLGLAKRRNLTLQIDT